MKSISKHIIVSLVTAACLSPALALAVEPMAAVIRVSGGSVHDYVVIGESPRATDGFDNAYDTLSPGDNLNTTYINAWFSHPEWAAAKSSFRGDIRSLAEKQEWLLNIASTLPAGTPLTVELQAGLNVLPQGLQLTVKDSGNTTSANLIGNHLSLPSPASGTTAQLIITALQPPEPPAVPATPPVITIVDGDVDGDGNTTIVDGIKILRMALGLDKITTNAMSHGDIDRDGKLTIRDALRVIKKVVGLN